MSKPFFELCNRYLPAFRWSFYWYHLVYYVVVSLGSAVCIYLLEEKRFSFLDCWFTTTSAHTVTGLGVLDFPSTTTGTKVICTGLICLGGQTAFALVPLLIRRWNYECTDFASRDEEQLKNSRTISMLIFVIALFALFSNVAGFAILALYANYSETALDVLEGANVTIVSFAAFTTISAFNNAGFSIFSNSLIPFRSDPVVLLVAMALILAGNTAFPLFLRTICSLLQHFNPNNTSLQSLLENPRAYTTHMFSKSDTRVLQAVFWSTNIFQFILYSSIPYFRTSASTGQKLLDMLFTTVSTRTAGFNVINLELLNSGILMCQLFFMYLSSYPIIVAVQSTSVVTVFDQESSMRTTKKTSGGLFVEVKKTLSNDLSWLAIVTVIIAFDNYVQLAEMFRLIWEVVSAYGTVGSSLSLPTNVSSFSSGFANYAKFMIIIVMLIGRHRSVPRNIDDAVDKLVNRQELSAARKLFLERAHLKNGNHANTIGHCTNITNNVDMTMLFKNSLQPTTNPNTDNFIIPDTQTNAVDQLDLLEKELRNPADLQKDAKLQTISNPETTTNASVELEKNNITLT